MESLHSQVYQFGKSFSGLQNNSRREKASETEKIDVWIGLAFQADKTKKGRQARVNKPTSPFDKVQLKAVQFKINYEPFFSPETIVGGPVTVGFVPTSDIGDTKSLAEGRLTPPSERPAPVQTEVELVLGIVCSTSNGLTKY